MSALAQRAPRIGGAWDWLRRESSLGNRYSWFGYLTIHNAPAVAQAIVDLLDAKAYTFVAANENLDLLHPEVRTGNILVPTGTKSGEAVTLLRGTYEHNGQPFVHIMVHDTYGVWGMSTSVASQHEAYEIIRRNGAVGLHHMSDPELKRRDDWNVVYLVIDRDRLLQVHQRTSAGGRTAWTIAPESGWRPLLHRPNKVAIEDRSDV